MAEKLKFEKQQLGGAIVATLKETDHELVEIIKRSDGTYDLIIHNRRGDTDTWDDCSAVLKPVHFAALAELAE